MDPDDDFRTAFLRNNEVFVAFKVPRMLTDMARLLLDSSGSLKPFEQWRKEVMRVGSHEVGLWESDEFIDDNTLTVNVARLRKKLENADMEGRIKTKKGIVYYLDK